jgi:hypothetical protein
MHFDGHFTFEGLGLIHFIYYLMILEETPTINNKRNEKEIVVRARG